MLESILNPKNAEDKPSHVFGISILYSFIAMLFAQQLFPSQSSMLTIALITIIFVPFFQKLFETEETADITIHKNLYERHKRSILVFSGFFLGTMFAVTGAYLFSPESHLFTLQTETLQNIGSPTGQAVSSSDFLRFLFNNTKVMTLIFILSAVMGAGAVFILAWNASVIGVFIGLFSQNLAAHTGSIAYIYGIPLALSSIALHGIPEILAYFVAGLAGGILSVGIIREKAFSDNFKIIFKDSVSLFIIAESLIIGAALLEALI